MMKFRLKIVKKGRKDTSLEAASVKELNIQPQEGKIN